MLPARVAFLPRSMWNILAVAGHFTPVSCVFSMPESGETDSSHSQLQETLGGSRTVGLNWDCSPEHQTAWMLGFLLMSALISFFFPFSYCLFHCGRARGCPGVQLAARRLLHLAGLGQLVRYARVGRARGEMIFFFFWGKLIHFLRVQFGCRFFAVGKLAVKNGSLSKLLCVAIVNNAAV